MTDLRLHDAAGYRAAAAQTLADGFRFAGLYAADADGVRVVRALFVGPAGDRRLVCVTANGDSVPTIVDLTAAAGWDEREAHDLRAVAFDGHEPLRPLVDHDPVLAHWTVPIRGRDHHQVAVGPIHAGVIESGHFRFHLVGERILHLDARLFYKHRGLEQAAEGQTLQEGLAYATRACAACWVTNAAAYAHACEEALGLSPTRAVARSRTILLELERLWNHLNDIAAVCAGVGLAAGNNRFAALTERARRLNQIVSGHRFLFGSVAVGGSRLELDAATISHVHRELEALRAEAASGWRNLLFNASFIDRLPDIGVLTAADITSLGAVGPAARAAGIVEDLRTTSSKLAYEGFDPVVVQRAAGDVQARFEQRAVELWQCLSLLESLLDGPVAPASATPGGAEAAIGIGRVESPRGATSCTIERNGDRLTRLHLRTGSYANWPAVAHAATNNLLPDFPLINKSFELCYACVDR